MQSGLKTATFWAVLWSVVRVGWTNLASFVMFVTLARILGATQFGLYALAAGVLDIVRVLANAGLSDAVQRERQLGEETADTAFTAGLGLSVLLVALTALLAVPYSWLMHSREVAPLLIVLSLTLPITALGNIHVARLLREFGHKYVAIRSVATGIGAGAVAIVAALLGAGVWALVIQVMLVEIIGTVVAWVAFPWRPRLRFDRARLRELLSFGGSMMLTQLLWAALSRVPELFIGRTLGLSAVGVYRVAWRAFDLIGQSVLQPMGSVALVTLSRLQDDLSAFRSAYCRILGLGALVALPLVIGFGLVAPDAVPVMFGEKWQASGPVASVLALSALPFTLNYFFPSTLAAKGRSSVLASIALLQFIGTLVATGLAVPYGLMALACAVVLRGYLTLPYVQYQLTRAAGVRLVEVARSVAAPLFCSLVMAAVVLLAQRSFTHRLPDRYSRLVADVAIGAVAYLCALLALGRDSLRSHLQAVVPLLRRTPAQTAE